MKPISRDRRAFTLVEAMAAAAVTSLVLASVTAGVMSLQRCFAASQDFITSHLEQVRAVDTLQRDARCAQSAEVRGSGTTVVFTIPTSDPGLLNLQLPSSLLSLLTSTSTTEPATKTVAYSFVGDRLTRTEGTTVSTVATRQTQFRLQQNGSQITTTLAFRSRFSNHPAECPATTMTAALNYRVNNW